MLHVKICVFNVPGFQFYVQYRMFHVSCYLLPVSCFTLHGLCLMSHVACRMFNVACYVKLYLPKGISELSLNYTVLCVTIYITVPNLGDYGLFEPYISFFLMCTLIDLMRGLLMLILRFFGHNLISSLTGAWYIVFLL